MNFVFWPYTCKKYVLKTLQPATYLSNKGCKMATFTAKLFGKNFIVVSIVTKMVTAWSFDEENIFS